MDQSFPVVSQTWLEVGQICGTDVKVWLRKFEVIIPHPSGAQKAKC